MKDLILINNFDIESNFWQSNTELKIPQLLNKFYKNDKSKGKNKSSKIMWAIFLLLHPKSKFIELPYDNRLELISSDYLEVDKNWVDKYEEIISYITSICITRKQRNFITWGQKLDERMDWIGSQTYSIENAETLDKILVKTDSIFANYKKAESEMKEEESKGKVFGDAEESLSEQNLI